MDAKTVKRMQFTNFVQLPKERLWCDHEGSADCELLINHYTVKGHLKTTQF